MPDFSADSALLWLCAKRATSPPPRVLLVAAHPDDETIGAGALLSRLSSHCVLVHTTDGAPLDVSLFCPLSDPRRLAYARRRRRELVRALALAGIRPSQLRCLGLIDQTTPFHLISLARRLAKIMARHLPTLVLTHPYEGGHPDHDATAFGVHKAVALLQRAGREAPVILEMTSYHSRDGTLVTGEFLPAEGTREERVALSSEERQRKRQMFDSFVSQRAVLSSFSLEEEAFRVAPRYDFTLPPHPGPLHYERLGWPMTGERWRALARWATEALRSEGGG